MKKTAIDKKAIVEELRKQDEQLKVIFERREELAKDLPAVWDMLYKGSEVARATAAQEMRLP